MLPTPDLTHLTRADFDQVYEPAEDSFLLLDALELDAAALRARRPRVCLEIGSGSGCVSAFLARLLGPASALFLCTDINPHAAACTRATARQNAVALDPVAAPFAAPLAARLAHAADVVLFNPPYVPTDDAELPAGALPAGLPAAWAGGAQGMAVTARFLATVEGLLAPAGCFYLVALAQNDVPAIRAYMRDAHALQSEIVLQRRAGREHLFVLRFQRTA